MRRAVDVRGGGEPGASWDPDRWVLVLLFAFTGAAVLGYGVFGLHPDLLPDSDAARGIYRGSFTLFARAHILVTVAALSLVLIRRTGAVWIPSLLAVYGVSFLAEHVGTGWGVPFGEYQYTALLGPRLLGRVPLLIPLSWFVMGVASYALAQSRIPAEGDRVGRIFVGAWLLTAWDLALDPAMSHLTGYWRWQEAGSYYGMPWQNLPGWLLTGLVVMGALEALEARRWTVRVRPRWWGGFYAAVLLMPLGMTLAAGLWPVLVATGAALALPMIRLPRPSPSSRPTGGSSAPAPEGTA